MNIFLHFEGVVGEVLHGLKRDGVLPADIELPSVVVEPPRDAAHGDVATNAAMVLAKPARMKPREIADAIANRLADHADIAAVNVAGPGFINMTLESNIWRQVVAAVLDAGKEYGRSTMGAGRPVNVEYVSANPTGPMHVGHCRGAVIGDSLANLLAFAGHEVTREYYINDAGAQIDVLARSVFLRYRQALGEDIGEIPEGLYPGDYLVPVGQALAEAHGSRLKEMDESDWLPIVRDAAIAAMMEMIRADLAVLNIHHDVFFSERGLHESGAISEMLTELQAAGHVYEGRLPPPKGQLPDDWEDREQLLFRSTEFGDDIDRALVKSDGTFTYFAADVAYCRDKLRRGFVELIYVLGADHGGYVKRLQAVCTALSGGKAELIVRLCQLVKLYRGGEPYKMSKRAGTFVTLRDVVDEVGRDPVRFMMLYRKNDAPLDFDFAKVTEQSKDNPVFYVQYAHARAHSVFEKAAAVAGDLRPDSPDLRTTNLALLGDPAELALIRRIAQFPRLVEAAAGAHEPHRVAFYLYDLASEFHQLWTSGVASPQLRFIIDDDGDLTRARLALVAATAHVIHAGLGLLGVDAPTQMR